LAIRWISAKDAIALVATEYGRRDPDYDFNINLKNAETALLTRLRHGALKSVASTFQISIDDASEWAAPAKVFSGKNDEIPAEFWRHISFSNGWGTEWVSGDFTIEWEEKSASGSAFNVHFDADNLPGLTASPIAPHADAPESMTSDAPTRGRPIKWDWDGALAYIVALANLPDGLEALADGPLRQADLERAISEWFIGKTGNAPATSQIRARASAIMLAVSEVDKSKPDF
jgi:hypothetical protein